MQQQQQQLKHKFEDWKKIEGLITTSLMHIDCHTIKQPTLNNCYNRYPIGWLAGL